MKTSEAITHYGSGVALTAALRLSAGAVSQWGEYPPNARQLQLERITLGALKAEPHCMDELLGLAKPATAQKPPPPATPAQAATETVAGASND